MSDNECGMFTNWVVYNQENVLVHAFYFSALMMGHNRKKKEKYYFRIMFMCLLPEKSSPGKSHVGTELKTQICRNLVGKKFSV